MNKKYLCIVCVILLLSLCGCRQTTKKYLSGKDTLESNGDGTYQLMGPREKKRLSNLKYNATIIWNVDAIQEYNGKVYATGKYTETVYPNEGAVEIVYRLYAVVDLQNNHVQFCASPNNDYYILSTEPLFIHEDMIANGDATVYESVTDFSAEDWAVFQSMLAGKD